MTQEVYNLIHASKRMITDAKSALVDNICSIIEGVVRIKDVDSQKILLPYPVMLVGKKTRGFNHGSFDFNLCRWLDYSKVRHNAWLMGDDDERGISLLTDLSIGNLVEVLKVVEAWAKSE